MNTQSFGYAMLQKMGWKEGDKIGLNPLSYRKELHSIEPRAPGLGLGAMSKQSTTNTEEEKQEEQKIGINIFDTVYIVRGRHRGVRGVLIRINDGLCVVEVNEEELVVPVDYIGSEYVKEYKGENGKAKKEKYKDWLAKNITVRISSKKFNHGTYYHKKAKIIDFVDRKALVSLDNGELLDGVKEKYLEPAPISDTHCVYVHKGEHKGKIADVVQFDAITEDLTVENKADGVLFTVPLNFTTEYAE